MIKEGRMIEAGLAKVRGAKNSGEWFKTALVRKELMIPPIYTRGISGK